MSLKWKELEHVTDELRPILVGSVLQKLSQSDTWANGNSFLFQGFQEKVGPWRLWTCLQQELTCLCLLPLDLKPDSAKEANTFVMVLRKHLLGGTITRVEQLSRERMVLLHFESGHCLLFELFPKRGNLILLDEWDASKKQGRCLGSFAQVSLGAGAIYSLPPPPTNLKEEVRDIFSAALSSASINEKVARFFWKQVGNTEFLSIKKLWRQAIRGQKKKIFTAIEKTRSDLVQAEEAELFQRRGILLVSKLYELGAKDFPQKKNLIIDNLDIPMDLAKSFSENAEFFFKKAKKFTRATSELQGRVQELEGRAQLIMASEERIENASNEQEIEKERSLVESLGVIIGEIGPKEKDNKGSMPKPFLEVISSEGFIILCGRNQEENRQVTFRESKGNDIWMHVKGMPGAHVVIKGQKNKTVPLSTLLEAAQLTLYHSKIRKGKRAEVDYTFRKFVKPIKGTLAEVTYTGNKTLYVEADAEALKKILK